MHTRIRKIRKSQPNKEQRTQQAFADKINISRSQLSYYESGTVTIPDRSVKDICEKYNVNEEWLRFGTGEMYKPEPELDELAYLMGMFVANNDESTTRAKILKAMLSLDDDWWKVIEVLGQQITKEKRLRIIPQPFFLPPK